MATPINPIGQLPAAVRQALTTLAAAADGSTPPLHRVAEGRWGMSLSNALVVDFIAPGAAVPTVILVFGAGAAAEITQTEGGYKDNKLLQFLTFAANSFSRAFSIEPGLKTIPRIINGEGLERLRWLHADHTQVDTAINGRELLVICPAVATTDGILNDPLMGAIMRCFLPVSVKTGDLRIRCRPRTIKLLPPGSPAGSAATAETPGDRALWAFRWSCSSTQAIYTIACPANIPPALLRALAHEGSTWFGKMQACMVEIAGPATIKGIDPRIQHLEITCDLTIRAQTVPITILITPPFAELLVNASLPAWAQQFAAYENHDIALKLLAVNNYLLDTSLTEMLTIPEDASGDTVAFALADRADGLSERDLALIVQNHFLPHGIETVLDGFFPKGSYDPRSFGRISRSLGTKLSVPLAQALKDGKNRESGMNEAALQQLVRAVVSGKLDLGTRGRTLITKVLGGLGDRHGREQLKEMVDADLPGCLLERVPPTERVKALTDLTEREHNLSFCGNRERVNTYLEAFSKAGKARALEDFDVLMKAWERGDIETADIVAAKTEACMFIARHLITTIAGVWPDSAWKKLQTQLAPEELLFLVEAPDSCLADHPMRLKLEIGITPDMLKTIKQNLTAASKLPQPPVRLTPPFIHRSLVMLLTPDWEPPEEKPKTGRRR